LLSYVCGERGTKGANSIIRKDNSSINHSWQVTGKIFLPAGKLKRRTFGYLGDIYDELWLVGFRSLLLSLSLSLARARAKRGAREIIEVEKHRQRQMSAVDLRNPWKAAFWSRIRMDRVCLTAIAKSRWLAKHTFGART